MSEIGGGVDIFNGCRSSRHGMSFLSVGRSGDDGKPETRSNAAQLHPKFESIPPDIPPKRRTIADWAWYVGLGGVLTVKGENLALLLGSPLLVVTCVQIRISQSPHISYIAIAICTEPIESGRGA